MTFDLTSIITIIVLVLILAFIIWRKWSEQKGTEEVKEFLDSMSDKFEGVIVDEIEELDFKEFTNLSEVEDSILHKIYDQLWDIAVVSLAAYVTNPLAKMLITKYLTKESVENFVKAVFRTDRVQTVYTARYNAALLAASNIKEGDPEKLEEETVAENAKIESEPVEPDKDPNWAETMDAEETKDVILNPANEDGEGALSEQDTSVEIVD